MRSGQSTVAGLAHIWSQHCGGGGGSLIKYLESACHIARYCSLNKLAKIGMWTGRVSRTEVRRQGDKFVRFKDKTVTLILLVLHKMLKECWWCCMSLNFCVFSVWLSWREDCIGSGHQHPKIPVCHWWVLPDEEGGVPLFLAWLMVCSRLDELCNECVDTLGAKKIAPVSFCSARHQTWDFTHARQGLRHWIWLL